MTTKPKTRQVTLDGRDITKTTLTNENTGAGQVRYKSRPNRDYYYSNSTKDKVIHLGPNDETIEGHYYHHVTEAGAIAYLEWVKDNCVWHRTEFIYGTPPRATIAGTETSLPTPKTAKMTVISTVHRKMTPALTEELAKVNESKAARVAKEKAAAKAEKAKRDKERRDKEKAAKNREASAEYIDLASALKVLKQHGLTIVSVEDKSKSKEKK